MSDMGHFFHQLTSSIISNLSALLQLKYQTQTQSPFPALPTPVSVAGYLVTLYYLIYLLVILVPRCRAVADHFLFGSAYAAVCTLAVAVFPPAFTPFLHTIFGLLYAGRMLYLFRDRLMINWGWDEDGDAEWTSMLKVYKRRVCRFLKNICRRVANFFPQQPILPI